VSENEVDDDRRRFLTNAATVVGGAGVAMAAVPFVASLQPSERAKAVGAPVEVDISQLKPGEMMVVRWRGKPVWVVRRTKDSLDALASLNDQLRDPDSKEPQQPKYVRGLARAINPEYLVLIGICTHLGCSPTYSPVGGETADLGPDWKGGFFCPCHGSRFDMAGRVYAGVPAPTNLEVPPHKYLSDTRLLIGVDTEKKA
jgi:ubiquinol-cytochrome c reductase iron-sulfur subunit